jgi:hypothetical protein
MSRLLHVRLALWPDEVVSIEPRANGDGYLVFVLMGAKLVGAHATLEHVADVVFASWGTEGR